MLNKNFWFPKWFFTILPNILMKCLANLAIAEQLTFDEKHQINPIDFFN